jgi:hypothetical protein
MSLRNALKKASELFVEFPEEQPDFSSMTSTKPSAAVSKPSPASPTIQPAAQPMMSIKQIVEQTEGPNLDQISVNEEKAKEAIDASGNVNFEVVYTSAGLTKTNFGAEEALQVINSLPPELEINVKRATVQATLTAMGKAMGVNTTTVVADASRKIAALSAYQDSLNLRAQTKVTSLTGLIQEHEAKIMELKAEIERTNQVLSTAVNCCQSEGERLDDVQEFFTLDIGASRNAPQ